MLSSKGYPWVHSNSHSLIDCLHKQVKEFVPKINRPWPGHPGTNQNRMPILSFPWKSTGHLSINRGKGTKPSIKWSDHISPTGTPKRQGLMNHYSSSRPLPEPLRKNKSADGSRRSPSPRACGRSRWRRSPRWAAPTSGASRR